MAILAFVMRGGMAIDKGLSIGADHDLTKLVDDDVLLSRSAALRGLNHPGDLAAGGPFKAVPWRDTPWDRVVIRAVISK